MCIRDRAKSVVIPPPVEIPNIDRKNNSFSQYIDQNIFNFGMHQRADDGIFSPILLESYSDIEDDNTMMYILGGGDNYRKQSDQLGIKNIKFFDPTGDIGVIHEFLSCLDLYTHARRDGEQCSSSIIEAMSHGLPFVSHAAPSMGHVDQIRNAGTVVDTADEYSKVMKRMMDDREYYNRCRSFSRKQYIEEYSVDSIISKYVEIYKEVVSA